MANLTSKELSLIEDLLSMEQNLIKKYSMYSQICTDPQLKTKYEQVAQKHQAHYSSLIGNLN